MLLAVSCMIMPTNAKAAKKAYIKTSTGSKATVFVGKTLKLNAKTVGKKKKITYRRKEGDGYKRITLEIIPENENSQNTYEGFLYVKE